MWKIVKGTGIIVFLIVCSLQDIREKKLSIKTLILFGTLFLASSLLFDGLLYERRVLALMPGMATFVLAFLTKEQIGYGDAACLLVLGNVVSADALIGALAGGLFLISIYSIVRLARKKATWKTTLPFLPFLTAGMLGQIVILWKGGGL